MLPLAGFEWDERKRRSNLAKHGLDFVAAARIFEGLVLLGKDGRRDYGEDRFQALGVVEGRVVFVAFTWRAKNRRIIQARIANRAERAAYWETLAQRR